MPSEWIELSIEAPPEYVEPLSEIFYRYGEGGVAVEQPGGFNPDEGESPPDSGHVRVVTYLPVGPTTRSREGSIDVGVRLMAQLGPVSMLQSRDVDEADWQNAWREHFHILHVGSRTVIVPTWRSYSPSPGDVVIELDPGMAFGTGHHPTTTMCLAALEELVSPGCSVLDLGCGSGILSIAAAKLGASDVLALDIDATAAETAAANVRQNGVDAVVTVGEGTLPHLSLRPGGYDIVVANISSTVIGDLAFSIARAARLQGTVVSSGVLDHAKGPVVERLEEAGLSVEGVEVDGDWVALRLVRSG
jgi:ribosomal protein L11 methyltransferase